MDTTSAPAASAGITEAPQANRSLLNGAEQMAQRHLAGARGQKRCQRQRGQDERHRQVSGTENRGDEYHQPDREWPQPLDEQCGQRDRDGQKRQGRVELAKPLVNGLAIERIGIIERAARRAVPQLEPDAVPQADVCGSGDQLTPQDGGPDLPAHHHAEHGDEHGECV